MDGWWLIVLRPRSKRCVWRAGYTFLAEKWIEEDDVDYHRLS